MAPITVHPAHEKAAHYFGFTVVHVPVGDDYRPNVWEYEQVSVHLSEIIILLYMYMYTCTTLRKECITMCCRLCV